MRNSKLSKLAAIFVALLLAVFMASSAMAFQVTNRSAEMDDYSPCDRAGTIKMVFSQADVDQITNYLTTHAYALIRIALNGTDLPAGPEMPTLCKDIHGSATATGVPNSGQLVLLDEIDAEMSDLSGGVDAGVYVHGNLGDQFISVYITDVSAVVIGTGADDSSWFKIGLYDELAGADKTSICADVTSFSGVSKLTISNEAFPNTLTFSGDNEIGHFLMQVVNLRDCDKDESSITYCSNTAQIELCPLGGTVQSPVCPGYSKCIVVEGDFAVGESIILTLRTNGAASGADTQNGVYFRDIHLFDEAGDPITATWAYYKADGITSACMPCASWEAETAVATILSDDIISAGNEVRFCITYTVNPLEAVAGTDVRFWAAGVTLPCGSIFSGVRTAATLVACGGISREILFPYFTSLTADSWWNGIAIVNLGSTDGTATLTAYEQDGSVGIATVSVSANSMYVELLENIDWAGTGLGDSPAYIIVTTDFSVDGFAMMATDSHDSMGYLPRRLWW